MEWTPITKEEVLDLIKQSENRLNSQIQHFWSLIQIPLVKWKEYEYGQEGEGFWVVAILGSQVIWYNDIEEGFNISDYFEYGTINEYQCEQLELHELLFRLSQEQ